MNIFLLNRAFYLTAGFSLAVCEEILKKVLPTNITLLQPTIQPFIQKTKILSGVCFWHSKNHSHI